MAKKACVAVTTIGVLLLCALSIGFNMKEAYVLDAATLSSESNDKEEIVYGDCVEETITIDKLAEVTQPKPILGLQGEDMAVPMFLYGESDTIAVPKKVGQSYYREMSEMTQYLYENPNGRLIYTASPLYNTDGKVVALYIYMKSEDGAFECSKIIE